MNSNGLLALCLAFILSATCWSCSEKSTDNGKARLEVRMTDDPVDYDAVNIDILDVQIKVTDDDNDDNGWQSLPGVKRGVYNLLNLVNDKDTLLVDAEINPGRLHQIRLVLGTDNTVIVDGLHIPLQTPSAQQSGLKLNVQQDVSGGILYTILLDFDAGKSIVKTGNGKYILKPVIRTVLTAAGGSIRGSVSPGSVLTGVYAIQGADTVASTFTGPGGGYLLKGLPQGSYDLHYWPIDTTYDSWIKNGVPVTVGNVTVVDTVFL
jgi:hypothetical protein